MKIPPNAFEGFPLVWRLNNNVLRTAAGVGAEKATGFIKKSNICYICLECVTNQKPIHFFPILDHIWSTFGKNCF